jgi:hypothetical protein
METTNHKHGHPMPLIFGGQKATFADFKHASAE